MMNRKSFFLSLLSAAILVPVSCQKERTSDIPYVEYDRVVLSVDPFELEDDIVTKLTPNITATNVTYLWAQGDTVGIYPDAGSQLVFPVADYGKTTASFDGGAWKLSSDHIYYAYVPYVPDIRLDKSGVPVSFLGQHQIADADATALRDYVFMSASGAAPMGKDLIFKFTRLGCLVIMNLNVDADVYTSLRVSVTDGTELPVSGKFDLTATSDVAPDLFDIVREKSWSLTLDDIAVAEDNSTLTCYMMVPPVDLTGKTVKFELTGSNGKSVYTAAGKNLKKSGASKFVPSKMEGIIDFKDQLVHDICVRDLSGLGIDSWDANGNGELEYSEAAAVTHIPSNLFFYKDITSFDELQYFTSLESIGSEAFMGCTNLTSITFPEGNAISVAPYAFYGCSKIVNNQNLTLNGPYVGDLAFCESGFSGTITLSDDIGSIEECAFENCPVAVLNIPQNVYRIGPRAFYNSGMRGVITIPNYAVVGAEAFAFTNITGVNIPASSSYGAANLPNSLFLGCGNLTEVEIPEGVTTIGDNCFLRCYSLRSVSLPQSLINIGENCFMGCIALESITIPSKVTEIKAGTFSACRSLSELTLPENLVAIEDGEIYYSFDDGIHQFGYSGGAFGDCRSLVSITLPASLTSIGDRAFSGCKGLTEVSIPDNVKIIGRSAFSSCPLTSCTLPENLVIYDASAIAVNTLTIPASVKTIHGTFGYNPQELYMMPTTPPTLDNESSLSYSRSIYVPASSVNAYKTATFWSEYADQIQSIPGGGAGGDSGDPDVIN